MATRITQNAVEVLVSATPLVRVTQNAPEVLVSGTPSVRVTQNAVEALIVDASARVTQIAAEVLEAPDASLVNARVTQFAVEVLLRPEPPLLVSQTGLEVARTGDPPLVVSQTGLEVAHAGDNPALVVSQMGIEVAWQAPKGTFPLNARLVYDDGYPTRKSNWFTVGSHVKKTFTGSFTASAVIKRTQVPAISPASTGFYVDAYKAGRFFLYAQVGYFFKADAEIAPRRFPADAVFDKAILGDFTVAAVLFKNSGTLTKTVNAVIRKTFVVEPGFSLSAHLSPRFFADAYIAWWFHADAIRHEHFDVEPGFLVDAYKAAHFSLDAFIPISVNARIERGFRVNAVIKRTMGPPGTSPLIYPGTNQSLYGNVANVLTPLFPISAGERLTVKVTAPPSDGGDLLAFNTNNLFWTIPTVPGEYVLSVLPGSYFIVSTKNNVYRPSLTGSGTYSNWAVSNLTLSLDAFVQPTFRVDANFVWTFTFPVTFDATIKRTRAATLTASAFIQPLFRLDAEIVPRHFHLDAWFKCEFHVDAWLIRRVTGTLTANAFVQPVFRVNAIKRKVQLKTFTVGAFKTAPVFGYFSVSSWVLAHFEIDTSFRVTKYRRFTADAWRDFKITSSFSADAFIKTYFYVKAVVYRPAEAMDPIPSFTLETRLVKLVLGDFTVGAFIDGWFTAKAVTRWTAEKTVHLDSAIVWKKSSPGDFAPFVMDASITGFLVNAVIKGFGGVGIGGQTYVFNLYALKGHATRTKTFLAQAEKRDPGAYWDQEWEIWRHMHFLADAHIQATRLKSLSINAAIVLEGTGQYSFYIDSWTRATNLTGSFTLEADVTPLYFTVTYEGAGKTAVVRNLITERLSFPGSHTPVEPGGNLGADNANLLSGPIYPIVGTPVTVTLWEYPFGVTWLDIVSRDEHQGMLGVLPAGPGTFVFWPSYFYEPHYVWAYSQIINAYDPLLAGSGLVSFYRDDTVTLSRPAPTIDAWVVGTTGTPFTLDAEVIGTTKYKGFAASAEIFGVGETRGSFGADAVIAGQPAYSFLMAASLLSMSFAADAVLFQPSFSLEAWVGLYFIASATIKRTRSWSPGPRIDAFIVVPIKTSSFTVGADIAGVGERHNFIVVDSLILGPRVKSIYLAAYIRLEDRTFSLDAVIGYRFTVGSWVGSKGGGMGGFHADAYIRGSAYIIFPADGGPKTDLYGNPPMIGRSFKVKIEAFIPDPIPMGNDPEIERLILLILEAEAELDAMYCAYTHYTPQGSTAKTSPSSNQTHPNPSGGGYTGGSLPNTISQIGYLGAGDIDDCWCVATIWAAKAAGVPDWHVSVTEYRHWARNPDRPGSTGGTLDMVVRGARGCWPNAKIRKYRSNSWDGFISLLKAGWVGSLAVRCSALPKRLQYHYQLLHQVGVAYVDGKYYIADPLAPHGSRPKEITGAEMRKAARGFVGGTICAALIS